MFRNVFEYVVWVMKIESALVLCPYLLYHSCLVRWGV